MKHRPSKTSHIYSYTKIQKIKQRDRSRRSSPPILLPRSGTSSGERDSGGSIVPRRNVFRSSRSPWKASWRCITKRWRGSRVCTNLPSSSSSSSSSRRRSGERRDPRKGRETTVEYREQQLGGKTKKERRRRRRKRGGSVGGVCSLLPGDRVHRLLRCRCPEIKNLREPGRSDNRRWDSLFHRKLIGEIGWRGKKEDLDEIYYPSEGEPSSWKSVPVQGIVLSLHALPFVTVNTVALCTRGFINRGRRILQIREGSSRAGNFLLNDDSRESNISERNSRIFLRRTKGNVWTSLINDLRGFTGNKFFTRFIIWRKSEIFCLWYSKIPEFRLQVFNFLLIHEYVVVSHVYFSGAVYLIKSIWFERVILKSWMKFMILVLARNVCKNRATGFAYRFYFSDMQSYNIYNRRRDRSRNWSTQIDDI